MMWLSLVAQASEVSSEQIERWAQELQPRIEAIAGRPFTAPIRTLLNEHAQVEKVLGIDLPEFTLAGHHDGTAYVVGDLFNVSPGMTVEGALEPAAYCAVAQALSEALFEQHLGEAWQDEPLQIAATLWLTEEACRSKGDIGVGWYRGMTGTAGYSHVALNALNIDPNQLEEALAILERGGALTNYSNADVPRLVSGPLRLPSLMAYLRAHVARSVRNDHGTLWSIVSDPAPVSDLEDRLASAPGPLLPHDYGRTALEPMKRRPPTRTEPNPFWLLEPLGRPGLAAMAHLRSTRQFDLGWSWAFNKDGLSVMVLEVDDPTTLRALMAKRGETTGRYGTFERQEAFISSGLPIGGDSGRELLLAGTIGAQLMSYNVTVRSEKRVGPEIREAFRVRKIPKYPSEVLWELWVSTDNVLFVVRTVETPPPSRAVQKTIVQLIEG